MGGRGFIGCGRGPKPSFLPLLPLPQPIDPQPPHTHTKSFPTSKPSSCYSLSMTALPSHPKCSWWRDLERLANQFSDHKILQLQFLPLRNPLMSLLSFLPLLFLKPVHVHLKLHWNKKTSSISLTIYSWFSSWKSQAWSASKLMDGARARRAGEAVFYRVRWWEQIQLTEHLLCAKGFTHVFSFDPYIGTIVSPFYR